METFSQLVKNLSSNFKGLKKIELSILSDSSIQFLSKGIKSYGFEKKLNIDLWEAPINQIEQQVLNPSSDFNENRFQTTLLFESTHVLLEKFNYANEKDQFAVQQIDRITRIVEFILGNSIKKIILFNFYELNDYVFGNSSAKHKNAFIFQLRKLNFLLSDYLASQHRASLLDISSIQNKIGSEKMFDSSLYINYGITLTLDSIPIISKNIVDLLLAQNSIFNKCLILDLDNTLWGGIIGDDGIENIQLGNLGIGKSFAGLQLWAKNLKERGIIICVCSKNNEEVAKNVFINHPDIKLKLEDISVFIANWDSKVDNIKKIQEVLNIGFDSMVFIDDNPYERNTVKENIPEITVPDLPEDPSMYLSFLYGENLFETLSSSDLDKERTALYQKEYERVKAKKSFTDLSDYMESLNMVSKVDILIPFNIPRVAQLSQRSNQFNLRTIRYNEDDLINIMNSDKSFGLAFDLEDRFGSHGIISYLILKELSPSEIFIENWAMSCRVLERGMEQFIINALVDFSKKKGYKFIIGEYIETKKNNLVKDLYAKIGFEKDGKQFKTSINEFIKLPTKIKIRDGAK